MLAHVAGEGDPGPCRRALELLQRRLRLEEQQLVLVALRGEGHQVLPRVEQLLLHVGHARGQQLAARLDRRAPLARALLHVHQHWSHRLRGVLQVLHLGLEQHGQVGVEAQVVAHEQVDLEEAAFILLAVAIVDRGLELPDFAPQDGNRLQRRQFRLEFPEQLDGLGRVYGRRVVQLRQVLIRFDCALILLNLFVEGLLVHTEQPCARGVVHPELLQHLLEVHLLLRVVDEKRAVHVRVSPAKGFQLLRRAEQTLRSAIRL
ncbi:hypothetical protein T484DRAFT_1977704 [Baffinella frigidus]|nr:hypothetical protein T484DRAFT_1977704 [Cryptophyta sp. CCMP2293]